MIKKIDGNVIHVAFPNYRDPWRHFETAGLPEKDNVIDAGFQRGITAIGGSGRCIVTSATWQDHKDNCQDGSCHYGETLLCPYVGVSSSKEARMFNSSSPYPEEF